MPNVLLCVPPDYDHCFPPLGTPALCAFLKMKGIAASQVDLNLGYRDFLTGRIEGAPVDPAEKRLFLKPLLKKFFLDHLKGRYYSEFLLREGRGSFADFPYDNNTNSSFYFTERLLSAPVLKNYLHDAKENPFYQYFEEAGFPAFLERNEIDLLGLSVTSPSQAVAALTLGLFVKEHAPHIHVNIGGQWTTLFREALRQREDLWECFDSMVVFEGETPFYRLAASVFAGRDISGIPNVIANPGFSSSPLNPLGEEMDFLPCPDFDGLPLNEYSENSGGAVNLTFETSRGCYWSKCAYCVDLPLPKPRYRAKSASLVARDIRQLKKNYGVDMLLLGDPGMSPRQMLDVSRQILKEKIEIKWWVMARLDPGFTPEIFALARQAGLQKINFGFESASDSICDLLGKGNRKERSGRVIRDCSEAGIEVDLQTILGLPRETFKDALETVDFLIDKRKFIKAVTFNIFYLTPENHVFRNPEKYGIIPVYDETLPFRFFIPFGNPEGMTRDEAHLAQQVYHSLFPAAPKAAFDPGPHGAEGEARLNLCGETAALRYLYNKETDTFYFLDDEHEPISKTA